MRIWAEFLVFQFCVWRAALCVTFGKVALGALHVGGNFEINFRMAERKALHIKWNMGMNGKSCCRIKVNHETPRSSLPVVGSSECTLTSSQQSSLPEANLSTSPYMWEEMKSLTRSQRAVLYRS